MTHPTAGLVSRSRAGFTLIEMMMAILLTMLVFAITIPFFRQQTMAVDNSAGRLDALQNARYAQSAIDRELRLAGGITGQPIIVQAAPFAITFNVDLVSRQAGDPNSTYYNPTADSLSTESWEPARAKTLPTAAVSYPTKIYNDASGIQSPAETISYFLYVDGTSGRSDLYVLYRRVNDRDSTVIARNIWIPVDTAYFFKYSRTDAVGNITAIPQASLPIYWNTANDPADSIRVVTMRVAGLYRDVRKAKDVTRTVYYNTRLLNAGMLKQQLCGDPPLPALLPVATKVVDSTGHTTSVHLTWNASLEEAGGEKDVALYLLMRRPLAGVDWEILGNVVAQALVSYSFDDFNPVSASSWVYGVVAQDCTPSNSTVAQTATVINP
jgi:type II secretory pathway pseudopilin PulG